MLFPVFAIGQTDGVASEVHISKSFDTLPLPPITWIYKEGKEPLSIEDVQKGNFKDATLIDLSDGQNHFSTAHRAFWFKVRISTDIAVAPFGLSIKTTGRCWPFEPTYRTVDSWQSTPNGWQKGYSGTAAAYSQRDYPQHLYPSMIKVDMQGQNTIEVWCRLVRAMGCDLQINLQLLSDRITNQSRLEERNLFWHNLFRGASITLLFMGLVFYFWYREAVFLWFISFLTIMISYRILRDLAPDVYIHFFPEHPRVINFLIGIFGALTLSTLLQFGRVFINTKKRYPRIDRFLFWFIILLITLALIGTILRFVPSLSSQWWYGVNRISIGVIFAGNIIIMLYFLFSKDKLARAFSIGAIAPFFIIFWQLIISYSMGKPLTPLVDFVMTAGLVVSMTLALVYRFRAIIQSREKAIAEKAKAELARSQQAIKMDIASNFFANITHEFRTPLTLILEPIRQLLNKQPNHPDKEKLTLVKGNSEKLLSLISQLLDLSKIEQNQMHLVLKFNDIHTVVRPIFNSFKILAEQKDIQLKMRGDKKIKGFLLDQQKMERIIYNLLSNAIKFTEKGSVELHLLAKNEHLSIMVKDTGIGIAEADLPYIFDRFHQVDVPTTRKNEGTGIGLALVKELVELMEGNITVESTIEKGTTFSIQMPMKGIGEGVLPTTNITSPLISVPASPVIVESTSKQKDSNQAIVLIVEDNHELRAFIRQSLDNNYQVIEASNGQEGIEKAKNLIPDLIVSDVMMPQKDGLELAADLKQDELTSHIPIILLTAKSKVDSKLKGLSIGADAYLTKPFNTQELLIRIEKLIELRRQLQTKYSKQIQVLEANTSSTPNESDIKNTLGQIDQEFLRKLNLILHERMSDTELSIEAVAKQLFMSRSQLFRKVKALTGESPTLFIRNFRLDQAHQLLKDQQGSITEICEQVGFGNEKYFVSRFKERFGVSPRKF